MSDFEKERHKMVEGQLIPRQIFDPLTLEAMRTVPRHKFVPLDMQSYAYADGPLPIGEGQTISQPYIVALMTQSAGINKDSRVLEIGTGSGYAAAVLSRIAKEVYTIERIESLAVKAAACFQELGYSNIHTKTGDGTLGWPEEGPYDAILVTAGAPVIPSSFLNQLKDGGRVIIPVGDAVSQQLIRLLKTPQGQYSREVLEYVRFVPLIGQEGW